MARKVEKRQQLLTNMPIDVLHLIVKHLSASSIVALRSTCKPLWYSLPAMPLSQSDRKHFERLLLRDGYDAICAKETWRSTYLSQKLLCSGCKRWRMKTQFSISQRWNPPQKRLCKGHEGVIYVCPHATLDREELKELGEKSRVDKFSYCRICNFKDNPDDSCCWDLGVLGDTFWLRLAREFHIYGDVTNQCQTLQQSLREYKQIGDIYLCPHGCWEDVLKDTGRHYGSIRFLWKCEQRNCETNVFLRRGPGSVIVRVLIKRRLGLLDDALDPRWLSQIRPKQTPNSFISFGWLVAVLAIMALADP